MSWEITFQYHIRYLRLCRSDSLLWLIILYSLRGERMGLVRYIDAQDTKYDTALSEIRDGRKTGHWMWYVFPQIDGLGGSRKAWKFAIKTLIKRVSI